MSQAEDLDAINRYLVETAYRTNDARAIRDEWVSYYDGIGWYGRHYDGEVYDHARNVRNTFNYANAITAKEVDQVQRVIETGATTEEMAGDTRRTRSDGSYAEPLVSAATKRMLTVGAVVVGAGWLAKKILPLTPIGRLLL